MEAVQTFNDIAPYLTHPLALIGFVLLLFFGIHRTLLKAKIIPPVGPQIGGRLVQTLLRYGFIIALVVIVLGFGLRYVALQNNEKQPQAEGGGIVANGDILVGPGSIVVGRDYYGGISERRFQALSEELGITKAALKNFLKILDRKAVTHEDLDSTLRKIAERYKALDEKLATLTSEDPAVNALKVQAREALEAGNLKRAETLLKEAKAKDIQAAKAMQEAAYARLLSAAASAAELGDLKNIELAYVEAAAYYSEAGQLVPAQEQTLLAGYLNEEGRAFYEAGRYQDAQPPLERALTIRENVLGPEHTEVTLSLNNLAELYRNQGRYAEAEPLYQRALAIREKVLDPEHLVVAESLNELAELYRVQGRYEEAEPLFQRALAIREKVLDPEHPDMADSFNSLAILYNIQGRYAEAEPFFQRALAIVETALGPEHPDVAQCLGNLASIYLAQGRHAEAEPHYQRATAIFEKVLGTEHPNLVMSLNGLALLYYTQGRYAEAEPLYQRALAIAEKALGTKHPNVAKSLNKGACGRTPESDDSGVYQIVSKDKMSTNHNILIK